MVSYSSDKHFAANVTTITAERAIEVINQNKRGENPVALSKEKVKEKAKPVDLATQEDLSRFDAQLASKKKKKKNKRNNAERKQNNGKEQAAASKPVDGAPAADA